MRFNNFVKYIVAQTVKDKYSTVSDLAENINGGWEVWLQVEIFMKLQNTDAGLLSFNREIPYGHQILRADFNFVPLNAQDVTTWVELKTERKSDVDKSIYEFIKDCKKVDDVQLNSENNSCGSVVVIPKNANQVKSALNSYNYDHKNKFHYFLFGKDDNIGVSKSINDLPQNIDNEKTMIIYYIKE